MIFNELLIGKQKEMNHQLPHVLMHTINQQPIPSIQQHTKERLCFILETNQATKCITPILLNDIEC